MRIIAAFNTILTFVYTLNNIYPTADIKSSASMLYSFILHKATLSPVLQRIYLYDLKHVLSRTVP